MSIYPDKRERVLGLHRRKRKRGTKILLVLLLLLGVSAFAFRDRFFKANLDGFSHATLRVDGLFCPACPPRIKSALEKIPGVIKADVELSTERTIITFDSKKVSPETFEKSISKIGTGGYKGTILVVKKGKKN